MLRGKTNYTEISYFTWSLIGKQNNILKFSSVSRGFSAVPVFQGVSECSGVPQCWGVPVFLVLVHARKDKYHSFYIGVKAVI